MSPDCRALIVSYIYLFGILFLGEAVRKWKQYPAEFTRKVIHVGVGFWGLIAYRLFVSNWAILIPPISFVAINILSYKWSLVKSMEIEDKSNLGTVFYPLSLSVLLFLFWAGGDHLAPLVGLMIMAMGDGFASIVGRKYGIRRYSVWHHKKSWGGSAAMFFMSAISVCLILVLFTDLGISLIVYRSILMGILAAIIEGVTPGGFDNLTVPLLSGTLYAFLF